MGKLTIIITVQSAVKMVAREGEKDTEEKCIIS